MGEFERVTESEVVKATFNLPGTELESLKLLARRRHIPVVQALRQAIASELFIQRLVDEGAKLLVQLTDGTLQQIVFSQAQSAAPPHRSAPAAGGERQVASEGRVEQQAAQVSDAVVETRTSSSAGA